MFAYAEPVNQASSPFIDRQDVKLFIANMVATYQFSQPELADLFKAVKVRPIILKHASTSPESWYRYQLRLLSDLRVWQGVQFWDQNADILARAEAQYGVPASIIVATIGIETKYGRDKGNFRVIDALVNLAFNPSHRAAYFKKELIDFLLLTKEQHLNPLEIMGSYAGAIGQPQFMPSSYRHYAVNFSGQGSIDLTSNEADVIGSIANYYHKNGWQTNQAVAAPVSLANGAFQLGLSRPRPISLFELINHGFITHEQLTLNGKKYNTLILQSNYGNEYWYTFHNFNVIKRYNHSDWYAMAVYQLSYYITMMRESMRYE